VKPIPRQVGRSFIPATWTKLWTVPFVCLLLFTFIVISERGSLAWLFICITLLGIFVRSRGIRFPAPLGWAAAFTAWSLLTAITAMDPALAFADALETIKSALIVFAVINLLRTEAQLRVYLMVVVFAFMVYPVRGALLNYLHGYTLFGRALWNQMYHNPNYLAGVGLLVLGVSLSLATIPGDQERPWVKRSAWVSIAFILTTIVLTQSRGSFIGLTLGMGIPALRLLMRQRSGARILAIVAVLIVALALVPQKVWHRYAGLEKLTSTATLIQADAEGSAAQRYQIQKVALRVLLDHPLIGVGLGCYPEANARYAPELGARDAHNTYFNLAAEVGLPGLILWIGFVVSVMRFARRCRLSKDAQPLAIQSVWIERGVVSFLIAGIFGTFAHLTHLYLIFGVLWCAARMTGVTEKLAVVKPAYPPRALAPKQG
jgi:putative inorganic carbon (hco3(-)) transporter